MPKIWFGSFYIAALNGDTTADIHFLIALLILHEIFVFGPRVLFALGFLFFSKKEMRCENE
jgi:hypothetical protein